MPADRKIHERLLKIKTLRDRALTDGERKAADLALQRGLDRAGLSERDLVPTPCWPRGLPPAGTRVMTPHGPGVVQKDARILLDPRPVFRFVQVQVISGVGGFPSSIVGTDTGTGTSTGSFSVNFS